MPAVGRRPAGAARRHPGRPASRSCCAHDGVPRAPPPSWPTGSSPAHAPMVDLTDDGGRAAPAVAGGRPPSSRPRSAPTSPRRRAVIADGHHRWASYLGSATRQGRAGSVGPAGSRCWCPTGAHGPRCAPSTGSCRGWRSTGGGRGGRRVPLGRTDPMTPPAPGSCLAADPTPSCCSPTGSGLGAAHRPGPDAPARRHPPRNGAGLAGPGGRAGRRGPGRAAVGGGGASAAAALARRRRSRRRAASGGVRRAAAPHPGGDGARRRGRGAC